MNTKYGTWRCMSEGERSYWRTVLDAAEVADLDAHL
jgi:hypothetical protein